MKAPLYDEVHRLAIDIANASAVDDFTSGAKAYDELRLLCFKNENKTTNHPLQWEALGDFSDNFKDATEAYLKGLSCAKELMLFEYESSILFALAELNLEEGNLESSNELAEKAKSIKHGNVELHDEIAQFIKEHRCT